MLKGRRACGDEKGDLRLQSGRAGCDQPAAGQAGSSRTVPEAVTPLRKWDCATEKEVLCRKPSVGDFCVRHNCQQMMTVSA